MDRSSFSNVGAALLNAALLNSLSSRKFITSLLCVAIFVALLLTASPGIGTESASFSWRDAWRAELGIPIDRAELTGHSLIDLDGDGAISDAELAAFTRLAKTIGFQQRFARSLLALQVGITLGICGAAFQILFRNPLATPYTLGIASGGSLGALIAIRAGWMLAIAGISTIAISAFSGAMLVVAAVWIFAGGARRLSSNELLLAGVTMGLFCSAMMTFVTAVSSERETFFMVRWMMGSLDPIRSIEGAVLLPLMLPAWIVLTLLSRSLNQYRLGDELAASRGVNVKSLQAICILVCTLATAGVVAYCGPIGFVGLMVPHIVALIFGSDCRILIPVSGLLGGAMLIICDWASQLSMRFAGWFTGRQLGSATLPIGVVTAIVGVPVFLILLRMRKAKS